MSYRVKPNKNSEYCITLHAINGQVILTSEPYSSKVACLNAIASIQKNSQDENHYQKKISSTGKCYFYLNAVNGQVIGKSPYYENDSSTENGILSVMRNGISEEVILE